MASANLGIEPLGGHPAEASIPFHSLNAIGLRPANFLAVAAEDERHAHPERCPGGDSGNDVLSVRTYLSMLMLSADPTALCQIINATH